MSGDDIMRLIDYDGRRYWLANGWSLRFRVKRVPVSVARPHGVKYAFTLHDADGSRLLGFDNAIRPARNSVYDHSHPLRRLDVHVSYCFIGADRLLCDFFDAVEAACRMEGVPFIIEDEERVEGDDTITD